MNSSMSRIERIFFLLFSAAVVIVLIMRAILVPFSHDEAATFFNYVQQFDPWPFFSIPDANNHILNSYITFLFYKLFGSGILVLRLSNLVFVPLYLFFIYKLSQEVRSIALRWLFILAMTGTFHFMEFFALTRGYGISLTFLMAAIWQVMLAMKSGRFRHFHFANLLMFLSCQAILIELYNFTLLLGWSALFVLVRAKGRKLKELSLLMLSGVVPLLLILAYTLFLQKNGAYIERGPVGLWDATLSTLMAFITGLPEIILQRFMILITGVIIVIILLTALYAIIRKKSPTLVSLLFPYLLFGNIVIIVLVVKLFFSDYPESRLVLFLFPFLVGTIIFTTDHLVMQSRVRLFSLLSVPVLIFPLLTIRVVNFDYVTWYKYCHIPQRFYDRVMKDYRPGEFPPLVSGYGTQAWAWQFLNRNNGGVANELCVANFPQQLSDYQIINLIYFPGWHKNFDTLDFDPVSKLRLLKRREPFMPVSDTLIFNEQGVTELKDQSKVLVEMPLNRWIGKHLSFDFDFTFKSEGSLFYGSLVIALYDTTGKNYLFDEIHLNWLRDKWDGKPHNFHKTWLMPQVPDNVAYVKIFLWNKNNGLITIKDGYIRMHVLEFPSAKMPEQAEEQFPEQKR